MNDNTLVLKSVNKLLGSRFFIPSYQRGYRWTHVQVKQLLSDIWEFTKREKEKNEFYCLQPVVVKDLGDNLWEVIDGQQRLTTIRIILSFLVADHLRRPLEEANFNHLYSIKYETRPTSEQFLNDIKEDYGNIDFYHFWKAYVAVSNWFKEKDYNEKNKFLGTLLANEDSEHPVKVIWYEVEEEDDAKSNSSSIDIFTRLNIGKIPLTNSELVKALFLQKSNFEETRATLKQLQIASEWDLIEKQLQDDSFWFFIYNPSNPLKYANRIEYIFDLMKGKKRDNEDYFTFNKFYLEFNESKNSLGIPDIDALWLKVKKYFTSFEGWFGNRELYHMVGYLVECGYDINILKNESFKGTKTTFKAFLKGEIGKQVNCQVDEVSYKDKHVKKVLLLFNIQTILATENADTRFPFNRYKEENWDIEHIRSQTTKQISGNQRHTWAKDLLEFLTGEKGYSDEEVKGSSLTSKQVQKALVGSLEDEEKALAQDLLNILDADKIEDEKFNKVRQKFALHFKERDEPENINSISNLALLDSSTNRSYKNAMFPIKRKIIIENDMNGVFVPICTKNLVLKSYSRKVVDVMYWKASDAKDYLTAIKSTLTDYLPPQTTKHEQHN